VAERRRAKQPAGGSAGSCASGSASGSPGSRRSEPASWSPALRPEAVVVAAVGLTALAMLGSYLLKRPCLGPTFDAFGSSANYSARYQKLCYSDIQQLWTGRGIREHTFPYLAGRYLPGENGGQLVGGAVEYPVVTGVFMWLAGLGAHTDAGYVRISAVLLLPFGLLTAGLLARLAGRRALIWAAAPALVLYGLYNWDFLATACVAAAVLAWSRRRPAAAGALLGLGAAVKIYPGFLALPLLVERLAARDARGALRVTAATAGSWLAVNLPILVANPHGWWATYEFQANRQADLTTNSIWYWGLPGLTTTELNHLTPVLIGLAWLVALAAGWWRARPRPSWAATPAPTPAPVPAGYPWLGVGAAMLCAFLLFNKVHSPQYTLWLLPFFVLLRVRWGWWVAYLALDVTLYTGLYRWYYDITQGGDQGVAKQAAIVGVWGKAVMLGLLYVVFLSSRLAFQPEPAPSGPAPADPAGGPAAPSESDGRPPGADQASEPSGAPSSTPPAGSSAPDDRTTSRSG
jgi:uncharacterized membrane protein